MDKYFDNSWYNYFICKYFIVMSPQLLNLIDKCHYKDVGGIVYFMGLPVYYSFYDVPQILLDRYTEDIVMRNAIKEALDSFKLGR